MEVILISWLIGVWGQLYQMQLWPRSLYLILFLFTVLALSALFFLKNKKNISTSTHDRVWASQGVLSALLMIAGFAWAGNLAVERFESALNPDLEEQNIMLTGVVDALPEKQSGRWRFVFQVKQAYVNKAVEVEKRGEVILPSKILLSWYDNPSDAKGGQAPEIKVGQEWSFEVRVKAPHGNINPHAFDYELWLWGQKIGAVGYVRTAKSSPEPELLNEGRTLSSMEQWRERTRSNIMQTVDDKRLAGLITALTLGDQRSIAQEDWDTFRTTGIAHLVSISGLHITMMAWIAYGVVGWLWRRSTGLMHRLPAHMVAMLVGLLCAALYAWFAGWGVPAQRTVLMLATVVVLRFIGVRWPWHVVWLFVGVVVVTIDPWAFLQAGFWLSFIAVGVLFAQSTQKVKKEETHTLSIKGDVAKIKVAYMPQPWWKKALYKLGRETKMLLLLQARISIAIAPLTLLLFQQVSVVGLFANMLAIPWVTFVMIPLVLLGVLFHPLWHIAAWVGQVLLNVLEWFASWPLSVFNGAVPPTIIGIIAVVGAVIIVLPAVKWRYRFLGALVVIPIFMWKPSTPETGEFEAIFLDVGQGSAVLVRTANHALLYDAGPKYSQESNAGAVLIVPTLRAMGVRLNQVVVSHADNDHSGGVHAVLLDHPQADLLLAVPPEDALWQAKAQTLTGCVAGLFWEWDGVRFETLAPQIDGDGVFKQKEGNANARSCVLRVTAHAKSDQMIKRQGRSILLTGDIEKEQEQALIELGEKGLIELNADVLLMPHHGSKTSSSVEFISAVSPQWAVAQAGYLNRYQHPAAEVVKRYRTKNVSMVNTASCGAATWKSVSPDQMDCERKTRKRYWQHQNIKDGLNAHVSVDVNVIEE